MTYTPVLDEDQLGISTEIDLFIRHVDSIGSVLPGMVMAVQGVSKQTWEDLKRFEENNCETIDDDKERTVLVPYRKLSEWKKLSRKHENFALASKLVPRSLIVSLVSQYDAYLGRLLRAIFINKPDLLRNSERKLSFEDIASLGSIEEARDFILKKEIESLLRSSHSEQFKWMENAFSLPLTKGLECWPVFIELTERRNLFVHTDGIISNQYLLNCRKHGCNLDSSIGEGSPLSVSAKYFIQSHECVYEIGVKLGHVLWRKLFPGYRQKADSSLIGLTYDLIDRGHYKRAICLLDFAFEGIKTFSNDAAELTLLINRAQAYKWKGDPGKCIEILNTVDWSAKADSFQLANAVLTDRFSDALLIMRRIGRSDSMPSSHYRDWPIFKKFREKEEFLAAYSEIFGEDFALHAESLAVEPLEDQSEGIDVIDDGNLGDTEIDEATLQRQDPAVGGNDA
ncbi:hypothetical protein [Cyanobium gracile]|uniref:Uncharacterized protein n=1 Tax=Cyanobium gracile (strain ATCC 27147 / PCC 6307) TaxID=292564 RepID=K9PCZ2_CYAGP|nr:hypothetical protein [Cyanobium gracile]AFY30394.1 hypothetical protein Cyagr_3322 [Cyanobium gracile PCC 6307]